jgi:hypothetical protein
VETHLAAGAWEEFMAGGWGTLGKISSLSLIIFQRDLSEISL